MFNHGSTWFNDMRLILSMEKGKKHGQTLAKKTLYLKTWRYNTQNVA